MDELGQDVVKGRKAHIMLKTCREIRQVNNLEITPHLQNIQFEDVPKDDSHLKSFMRTLKEKVIEEDFNLMEVIALENQMNKGIESERKMIEYHDFLITSMNLSNPPDANADERDIDEEFPNIHPCSNGHLKNDKTHNIGGENENITYSNICNFCERHRHNKGKRHLF